MSYIGKYIDSSNIPHTILLIFEYMVLFTKKNKKTSSNHILAFLTNFLEFWRLHNILPHNL